MLRLVLMIYMLTAAVWTHADGVMAKHIPFRAMANAQRLSRVSANQNMQLSVALKPRNPEALQEFLKRVATPGDRLYGHYLSPQEFAESYGASSTDVDMVKTQLKSMGFKVLGTAKSGLAIQVAAPVGNVEKALKTEFHNYRASDGRLGFSLSREPTVSPELAKRIHGFVGVHNFIKNKPQMQTIQSQPNQVGSAPGGFLSPKDLKTAYGIQALPNDGAGETVAVITGGGYNLSDIQTFASTFGLSVPVLQNILIDGFKGTINSASMETEGDIEMVMIIAPKAKIIVYESDINDNSGQTLVDLFTKVADGNLATIVTHSYAFNEADGAGPLLDVLNNLTMQMAAQGQTFFNSSGDNGADNNQKGLSINGFAGLPYVTAVGGTALNLSSTFTYVSETTWNEPATSIAAGGSGGGISSYWPIPSYQSVVGVANARNFGSSNHRMIPDVALVADISVNAVSAYELGKWYGIGGTSVATPLWAGLAATINQKRHAQGLASLGFINPGLYRIGQSSVYAQAFHDVANGSTNGFYPAVSGYDLATGWGSFNGLKLFNLLSGNVLPPNPPAAFTATVGQ